jgi:glucokinase
LVVLNAGEPNAVGNLALISAGTGLGEAGLHWDRHRHVPFTSEGGHADFAPRDQTEVDLLFYLLRRLKRVSYERVLSGPGLYNIYQFLRDTGRAEEPPSFAELLRDEDPAPVISRAALDGSPEICVLALDMFVSFYGAEAGNLVLKLMATGGLYIGGGIAPRIIDKLREPAFWTAFTTKGRLSPLLEATPVRVIMNDKTALLGAARLAAFAESLR